MKKIAVLNDLSGLGKCSLTAAIPVISVMGVQACPLPTAVLSAQTGFSSYYYHDFTSHMQNYMEEWKKMNFVPDGIYSGFLSGAEQAEIVLEFFELFGTETTRILVDPVMGDNGEEYPIYSEELCSYMRRLCRKASLITPNLTEALLLLYGQIEAREKFALLAKMKARDFREEVEKIGKKLALEFETEAVITGIDLVSETGEVLIANLICRAEDVEWVLSHKEGGSYSGTGDLFASILAADMVKDVPIRESVKKAVDFLSGAIHDAVLEGTDRNEGVCFEKYLGKLVSE